MMQALKLMHTQVDVSCTAASLSQKFMLGFLSVIFSLIKVSPEHCQCHEAATHTARTAEFHSETGLHTLLYPKKLCDQFVFAHCMGYNLPCVGQPAFEGGSILCTGAVHA